MDADTGTPRVTEALDAGFTRKYAGPGATGFAGGSLLDVMLPGRDLAWHAASARRRGLATLSDNELCGVMGAARRLESWAAGLRLATVNELDTRRAGPSGRPGEHVAEEVGAVLILTPRAADNELGLARNLARVPQTRALLSAGILDQARAEVIADALAVLDPVGAATVENLITPRAAELTAGQLRAACERAIKAYDPQAATRRREKAQRDARVECWAEAAGTSAIAGRDLVPAGVIAADKTLDADARWLRTHGMPGSHDERRAAAFLARLTNRPLTALLPAADAAPEADSSAATSGNPATGTGAATGTPASGTGAAAGPSTNPADTPGTNPAAPPSTSPADTPGTNPAAPPSTSPADTPGTSPAAAGWVGGLGGTVNLTMPASAWLGLSDAPGEAGGPGALDADTCRDLAAALAANPATRWCVTIVDRQGRATAHGCARQGPGPPVARDGPRPTRCPRRTKTARRHRPCRLARHGEDLPDRNRQLLSPARIRRLPAIKLAAAHHQDPQPAMRVPRLPTARHPLRRRSHHPLRQGRPDLRVQPSSVVQKASPGQASTRLAPRATRTRRPDLAPAPRPQLRSQARAVPRVT